MVFANPVPRDFGDGTFYDEKGSRFYLSDEKLKGDYSPVRYEREIKLLRRFCKRGKILDVGCSTGGFLFYLNQTFPGDYEIWGTDVAREALAFAKTKGVNVIDENFFDLKGRQFDAITFWAVLEHLLDPQSFLKAAKELLHPDGFCIVLVPNFKSLATRMLGSKYRYILPQHLNYFTNQTVGALAQRAGFHVVHRSTMHFNPIVIWQDLRAKGTEVSDEERAALLAKTNAMKQSKALGGARAVYRFSETLLRRFGFADNLIAVLKPR
jgi:2-polyprenyl-3-methyl-5-hydroxy-6-metoxy-1,4-benzoquinol methylase